MMPKSGIQSASAHCLLDDGRLLTVQASCRVRDGRTDIKCHGPREVAMRVQQILRLARHTEAEFDARQQVVITLDPWPQECQREWELALVLADRMVRGLYAPDATRLYAHGWSDHWERGQVEGGDAVRYQSLLQTPGSLLVLGGSGAAEDNVGANAVAGNGDGDGAGSGGDAAADSGASADAGSGAGSDAGPAIASRACIRIPHLGALLGHPDPLALVAASRCWFPLFSGGVHDSLNWVEVSVRPLMPCDDDEAVISVVGLDLQQQQAVRQVLLDARSVDVKSTRQWRSVVRFGYGGFYGDSYQLALVLADRIARGREFPARGRIIASGRSSAWHTGMVESVDECDAKCALILQQVQRGDRVLLPSAWEAHLPPQFMTQLASRGASCACVAKLGLL